MRILHIADLHLGQVLNGWSREAEHKIWLDRVADLIAERHVQAVLVCGDVFDGINPSGSVYQLFFGWLARLSQLDSKPQVIITSGNHDPVNRLEAPGELTETLNIHIRSSLRREAGDVSDQHLIELKDADGTAKALVCAIPFLRSSDLPGITYGAQGQGSPIVAAARRLHNEVAEMAYEAAQDLPIICMGHLHCRGARDEDGNKADRSIIIGGEHALPADVFPDIFTYVALGHIHRAQSLDNGRIRYSGSPFPLSASEIDYRHGVTLIDLFDSGEMHIDHIEIDRPVAFHRLPDRGVMSIDNLPAALAALELDPEIHADLRPFVYVTLEATGPASVLMEQAGKILEDAPIRVAGMRVLRTDTQIAPIPEEPVKTLAETDPIELFRTAFFEVNQTEPEDRHLRAFQDALNPED